MPRPRRLSRGSRPVPGAVDRARLRGPSLGALWSSPSLLQSTRQDELTAMGGHMWFLTFLLEMRACWSAGPVCSDSEAEGI